MKYSTILASTCLLLLAGCSGSNSGQIKLPKNAEFGLWTSKPANEVAQCIARETNGTVNGSTITGASGAQYLVGPAKDGSAYPTQVSRFGSETPDIEKKVIDCTINTSG